MVSTASCDTALPASASVTTPSASTARPTVVIAADEPPWLTVPPAVVVSDTDWPAQIGALRAMFPAAVSRTQPFRSSAVWLIGASIVTPPVRARSSRYVAWLVTSTGCTTCTDPPAIVVVLSNCEKPPYCEPMEPTFTAPVPAASSPNTTRFQPLWMAKMAASVMLRPLGTPGGEAIVRSRERVRGLTVSVAVAAPAAVAVVPIVAVPKLTWSVVKITSPSTPDAPLEVKFPITWTSVLLVIAASFTATSPRKRVVPVALTIVSEPPTVSVPPKVTLVALTIVRLPSTVTLPEKVTLVASVIVRSPSMSTVLPTVNVPALVTSRSPVSDTDCWRFTGWAVSLVSVRSSIRCVLPMPPVTVM